MTDLTITRRPAPPRRRSPFAALSDEIHDPRLIARRAAMVGESCPAPADERPFRELCRPARDLTHAPEGGHS